MTLKTAALMLALSLCVSSCDKADVADDSTPQAESATEEVADENPAAAGDAESTEGTVSFTIDGEKKTFAYLPAEKNMAMSVSTMITARPKAGATEEFMITAMNFDVRKADLPATLKLDMKKAMEKGKPMDFAKSPKPLIQYKSPDGVQYRSYAEISFESYKSGVANGKVSDLEIGTVKPKDKEKPPVKLTGLTFQVKL
jgi:hypothetical protein